MLGIGYVVFGESTPVMNYIVDNWSNVSSVERGTYPSDWNCADISNAYMKENSQWRGLGIIKMGSSVSHATNYQVRDDILFIHDETWGYEYEFSDWKNMTLCLYDYNETIPTGMSINIVNVDEFTK